MEISVFDRDTDLKRLNAAVNTYPFFGGSSLVIISDDKIFAAEKSRKKIWKQFWQTYRSSAMCLSA